MMKVVFVFAALAAASPVPAASEVNPLAKEAVSLDLRHIDLATVEGQRVLAIRMDQAAREVCGDRVATIHLALNDQSRACQAEVTADIRSRIEARNSVVARGAAVPGLAVLR